MELISIHSISWTLCNTSIFAMSPRCRQESIGNLRTVHFAAVHRVVIQVEPVLITVNRGAMLPPAVLKAVRTTGGRWYALKQSHHRIYSYDWYNSLWSPFLEQIPISDCRFGIRRLWVARYPSKSLSNLIKCPLNSHQIPSNSIKFH